MSRLSVSIVTYNSAATIRATLDSLLALTEPQGWIVYLVDNGSSDQTTAILDTYGARIRRLGPERGNIGFGAAHNRLLPLLDSDYHLILNPDVAFRDMASLTQLTTRLDTDASVGLAAPRIVSPRGELQMLCRRDPTVLDLALRLLPQRIGRRRQAWHTMQDRDYSQSFDVPFASGCCLLIRTRLWRDLGGFDERFFLYLEDADLTRRVRQIARAVYVPESTVVHAWQRGSYRSLRLALTHLVSLARYFSKWGWRWR